MTTQEYEAKRAAKVERLESAAEKATAEAQRLHNRAHEMASIIPLGQPILIGHHSEKRDRRYRARIGATFDKAIEAHNKAEYYKRRAISAAANTAIFSDDPSAGEKLEAKISRLEKQQEIMKAANKAIRKGDDEALRELGFSDQRIAALKLPDFCGRIGFPDYAITNNGANIRRLKQRLQVVDRKQGQPTTTTQGSKAQLEDCPSENRVGLFFPGKPSEEARSRLKAAGFRWSPTIGAWQAYHGYHSLEVAKQEAGMSLPQPSTPEAA